MIFYLVLNDGHLTPFQTIKNFLFLTEFGSSNVLTVFKVTATFQTLPSEVVHDDLFNTDNDSSEVFKSRRWNQNRKLLWSRAKLFWYPRSKKAPKLNEEKCSIWKTPSTRRELDTPFDILFDSFLMIHVSWTNRNRLTLRKLRLVYWKG